MNIKIAKILFKALECAKQDRISLIDAYGNNEKEPAVMDAKSDLKAFESVQKELFGTTDSELNAAIKRAKSVDIMKLLAAGKDLDEYIKENSKYEF